MDNLIMNINNNNKNNLFFFLTVSFHRYKWRGPRIANANLLGELS